MERANMTESVNTGRACRNPVPISGRITCTIPDACDVSGLKRSSIYKALGSGKLKSVKVGRRRLVLVPSLLQLLDPKGEHWPIPDRPSTPEAAR
jgi:hypothetical protein